MLTHTIRFTNFDLMNKMSVHIQHYGRVGHKASMYISLNYSLKGEWASSSLYCRAPPSQTFQLIWWGQNDHNQTLCWCYGIEELRKQQLLAVKLHGLVQNTKGNGAMKRDKITKWVEYGKNSAVIKKLRFSMIKNHRDLKVSSCTA